MAAGEEKLDALEGRPLGLYKGGLAEEGLFGSVWLCGLAELLEGLTGLDGLRGLFKRDRFEWVEL